MAFAWGKFNLPCTHPTFVLRNPDNLGTKDRHEGIASLRSVFKWVVRMKPFFVTLS